VPTIPAGMSDGPALTSAIDRLTRSTARPRVPLSESSDLDEGVKVDQGDDRRPGK
jgi:hypothetical protein